MKYRPYWLRILLLAATFNLFFLLIGSSIFSAPLRNETPQEDLIEVEWIATEETVTAAPAPEIPATEIFSEIILPPLEIPHTEFAPLPKLEIEPPKPPPVQPQTVEKLSENNPEEKPPELKPEKPEDKLKAIVKVYPKDIIPQFIQGGIIREPLKLASEKIVLAVTITIEGKVRDVEIRSGGDGAWIDFISKNAAGGWIFEPYLDVAGNPIELKTQIEFTPENF